MFPYLITFFLSIVLCAGAERVWQRHHMALSIPFLAASVLAPTFLAGARDFSVGTDIQTYGNYVFQYVLNRNSLASAVRGMREIDPLYKALAYEIAQFTDNPHWLYFFTALIICGFTMAGLLFYRRYCSVTLGWTCFLFLFYGDTLNTMRQCLALAVVFCGFSLFVRIRNDQIYRRRPWPVYAVGFALCLVLLYVGVQFHTTGMIAVCLPVLYLFLEKVPLKWVQFFFVIACMAVIMFYSPVARGVLRMGFLPAKFSRYLAKGVAVALKPTILRLPFVIPILFYYDRYCGFQTEETGFTRTDGMFITMMLFLEICTVQLRSVLPALYRISYYFGYFRFLAYPRLVRILRRDNRALVTALLVAYLVVVWYYQNVMQGNNEIYPYVYAPDWWFRNGVAIPVN